MVGCYWLGALLVLYVVGICVAVGLFVSDLCLSELRVGVFVC